MTTPSCNNSRRPHHKYSIYHYKTPNFEELSSKYPEFKIAHDKNFKLQKQSKKSKNKNKNNDDSRSSCNNTDDFVLELTRALLHQDFHVRLNYTLKGHLIPPVPNRLNYVCWVKELLQDARINNNKTKRGIDIGTGMCAIYPLLICTAPYPQELEYLNVNGNVNSKNNCSRTLLFDNDYKILASEIDEESAKCAQHNIDENNLSDRVQVQIIPSSDNGNQLTEQFGPLRKAIHFAGTMHQMYDFVMTNPPFYESNDEVFLDRIDGRDRMNMSKSEGICEKGGEVGFVKQILQDSLACQTQISWYTTMFGHKASLVKFEKILKDSGLCSSCVKSCEFVQGKQTRWGLAWTFISSPVRSIDLQSKFTFEAKFDVLKGKMVQYEKVLFGELKNRLLEYSAMAKDPELLVLTSPSPSSQENGEEEKVVSADKKILTVRNSIITLVQDPEDLVNNRQYIKGLLPIEGHFLIDVSIDSIIEKSETFWIAKICVESFSHSSEGNKFVSIISNSMPQEVARTNRRWKRKRKRAKMNDILTK